MALDTYCASINSAAGANKRHLALFNAAGSGVIVRVFGIAACGAPAAAVTGLVISLYAVRITAAPTGGSAVTVCKADTDNPNLPAQLTVTTGATGGATEEASAFGVGEVSGEETVAPHRAELYRGDLNGSQLLTIREGQGVLVKQTALASAGNVLVSLVFGVQ